MRFIDLLEKCLELGKLEIFGDEQGISDIEYYCIINKLQSVFKVLQNNEIWSLDSVLLKCLCEILAASLNISCSWVVYFNIYCLTSFVQTVLMTGYNICSY